MNWGITSLLYHRRDMAAFLADAVQVGYQYIELNCVKRYFAHFDAIELASNQSALRQLRRQIDSCQLRCSAIDCHGLLQGTLAEAAASEVYTEAGIMVAEALSCPLVITSFPPGEAAWSDRVAACRRLCRRAAERNIQLAIEVEYRFPVGNREQLRQLLTEVGHPALKVNFDPTHFAAANDDPVEVLREFAPVIAHVHLKDAELQPYRPVSYRGAPDGPAGRMLAELDRLNYNGVVSVETLADCGDEPEKTAREVMAAIQEYCQQTGRTERVLI